jgi:acetyl-CoA C-acetyltransferase
MDESRIPVMVGCGQFTQRERDPKAALGPIDLMARVAKLAAQDTGAGQAMIDALDTLAVVRMFSDTSPRFVSPFGNSTNPPKSLADRIGASGLRKLIYTHPGGNMPQWTVNRLSEQITRGEVSAAMVVGAEALATQKAAERQGVKLDWNENPGGSAESWGVAKRGWSDCEDRHGARAAIYMYPMLENAIRHHAGRTLPEHQAVIGTLMARFAAVAAANPLADRRDGFDATRLTTVAADNPYISFPYTRLLNSNAFIDQGAAVIVCSVAAARKLGIARDRWVFLHGCADAHDHWYMSERRDYHSCPAMKMVFDKTFEMAGLRFDQIDRIDLYSCFSSAVEIACQEMGISPEDPRGLTVTGGLPFFGGPGNNYVTHSIAEMMNQVRAKPGSFGLVTANGNYVTKHSAGIYSTEMPTRPFAPENPDLYQATLDAMPKPAFAELAQGAATVETYTVIHDKAGPSGGLLFGRLPDGTRFMANTPTDRGLLDDMESREFIGVQGNVVNDGKTNVFSPA